MDVISIAMVFTAGCFGGLVNSIAVWGMGKSGITRAMGVNAAPDWSPGWLYPRLVWGGLWGFLFLLPYFGESIILKGIVYSLGPTLGVLLVVFPFQAKKGFLGLQLGALTPVFALIVNAAWGISAAWWLTL